MAYAEAHYKTLATGPVRESIMSTAFEVLRNFSIATLPTLLDLLQHIDLKDQQIEARNNLILDSVAAGINSNALMYRF